MMNQLLTALYLLAMAVPIPGTGPLPPPTDFDDFFDSEEERTRRDRIRRVGGGEGSIVTNNAHFPIPQAAPITDEEGDENAENERNSSAAPGTTMPRGGESSGPAPGTT